MKLSSIRWISVPLTIAILVAANTSWCAAPDIELIKRVKATTALIVSTGDAPSALGTSFCIHKDGYFLTAAHTLGDLKVGNEISLVLNSGEEDESKIGATIVRVDAETKLALLKTKEKLPKPKVVEIGNTDKLVEATQVYLFSYPAAAADIVKRDGLTSIRVIVGYISSLEKNAGKLQTIRVDYPISTGVGSTGGAVIAPDGKVVGVVGPTTHPNQGNPIIPANHSAKLLARPDVKFEPPVSIAYDKRHEPAKLSANVVSLVASDEDLSLSLTLEHGDRPIRKIQLEERGDGEFSSSIPLVVKREGPILLPVDIDFSEGSIHGNVEGRSLALGNKSIELASISTIERTDKGWMVRTKDGKVLSQKSFKLKKLKVDLGGSTVSVDTATMEKMTVHNPAREPTEVHFRLEASAGDKIVETQTGIIKIIARPQPVSANNSRMPSGDPTFDDNSIVKFPEQFASFDVGRFGQYFLFHLKEAKKVVVLDVLSGKFVHEIERMPDDVIIAAGGDKMILVMPGQKMMQRWSLETFEREQIAEIPDGESPGKALLGANATGIGPLALVGRLSQFIDITTLKKANIEGNIITSPIRDGFSLRGSYDSQAYGGIPIGYGPVAFSHFWIKEGKLHRKSFSSTSNAIRSAQPTADGSLIFSTTGIWTGTCAPVAAEWLKETFRYPTVDPGYFVAIKFTEDKTLAHLCTVADRRIVYTYKGLDEMVLRGNSSTRYSLYRRLSEGHSRFHWIPWAGVMLTMNYDSQSVHLRKIDLTDELRRSGKNYLFVDSVPPLTASKGRSLEYKIAAKSNERRIHFRLDAGPDGMKVDKSGSLSWDIPKDFDSDTASVIVGVSAPSGEELFHSFEITLE